MIGNIKFKILNDIHMSLFKTGTKSYDEKYLGDKIFLKGKLTFCKRDSTI
jgi:hypothetical protein